MLKIKQSKLKIQSIVMLLAYVISFIGLEVPTFASGPDYNPNLLIFQGEIRNFMEAAGDLRSEKKNESSKDQSEKELQETAYRAAHVYFEEKTPENQQALDQFLTKALKENDELKNYFVFLGNAFVERAQTVLEKHAAKQKKTRMIYTVVGAVVGVAVGGGYLYLKAKVIGGGAPLTIKDYLIGATSVVGLTAAGYGVGAYVTYKLPVDRSITNAKDFNARYPHGEDFIKQLETHSVDLELGLARLDRR